MLISNNKNHVLFCHDSYIPIISIWDFAISGAIFWKTMKNWYNTNPNHPPGNQPNFPKPQGSSYFCDSSLYASKGIFDEAAVIYQEDLNKKGYKYKLKHEPSPPITQRKTWYCVVKVVSCRMSHKWPVIDM